MRILMLVENVCSGWNEYGRQPKMRHYGLRRLASYMACTIAITTRISGWFLCGADVTTLSPERQRDGGLSCRRGESDVPHSRSAGLQNCKKRWIKNKFFAIQIKIYDGRKYKPSVRWHYTRVYIYVRKLIWPMRVYGSNKMILPE